MQGQLFKVNRRIGFKRSGKKEKHFRISTKEMETLTHDNIAGSLDAQFKGETPNNDWRLNRSDPYFRRNE